MTDVKIDLSVCRPRCREFALGFYEYSLIRHVARETDALRSLSAVARRRMAARRRAELRQSDQERC